MYSLDGVLCSTVCKCQISLVDTIIASRFMQIFPLSSHCRCTYIQRQVICFQRLKLGLKDKQGSNCETSGAKRLAQPLLHTHACTHTKCVWMSTVMFDSLSFACADTDINKNINCFHGVSSGCFQCCSEVFMCVQGFIMYCVLSAGALLSDAKPSWQRISVSPKPRSYSYLKKMEEKEIVRLRL